MTSGRLAATLAAALAFAPALPAKDLGRKNAAEANAATPADAPAAVAWPRLAPGDAFEYDSRQAFRRVRPGSSAAVEVGQRLRVVQDASGNVQHWTWHDTEVGYQGEVRDATHAIQRALAVSVASQPVRVRLSGDGAAEAVLDVEALVPAFRAAMERALAEVPGGRPGDAATVALFEGISRPEVYGAYLLKLPTALNFPAGGGLVPGERYSYDDEVPNPVGGEPFPMRGEFLLEAASAGGEHQVRWEVFIDPVKGAPILWRTVERLLGEDIPDDVRSRLPEQIHMGAVTRYRIDPATGVVTWIHAVETRRVLQNEDVVETTLELRRAPSP